MLTKLKHYATRIGFEGILARLMVVGWFIALIGLSLELN